MHQEYFVSFNLVPVVSNQKKQIIFLFMKRLWLHPLRQFPFFLLFAKRKERFPCRSVLPCYLLHVCPVQCWLVFFINDFFLSLQNLQARASCTDQASTSFQQSTNALPRAINLALVSFPAMMRTVFDRRMLSIMLFSLMIHKYIYFAIHLLHKCLSFLAHGFVNLNGYIGERVFTRWPAFLIYIPSAISAFMNGNDGVTMWKGIYRQITG